MDEVDHPVDMIIYMHGGMPRDVGPWQFRAVIRDFHPNLRSTALVGVNAFIRQTINAFMRVVGQDHHKFFFAATLEEAIERIAALNDVHSAAS